MCLIDTPNTDTKSDANQGGVLMLAGLRVAKSEPNARSGLLRRNVVGVVQPTVVRPTSFGADLAAAATS